MAGRSNVSFSFFNNSFEIFSTNASDCMLHDMQIVHCSGANSTEMTEKGKIYNKGQTIME